MSDNKLPNNRKGWLTPQQKLVLIHSVDKGRFSVSEACRQAEISRKTFYKWRNRYCAAKAEAAKVFEALSPKKKTYLQRHPRRSADLFATEVLEVVKRNPSLSSREIAKHVCLSMTGVWGVLKRAGLATQRERKHFRRLQLVLKPWLALVFVIEYLLGGVIIPEIPLIYPLLLTIPKERRPTILYIPLLLLILGAGWRLNQTLFIAQPSLAGRVGLVFAEIALIFGMFFFIYSVRYYLTLALVLASSRRTNGASNGFLNGLKNGINGSTGSPQAGLNGRNGRLNGFFNGNGRLNGFLNGLKKGLNNGHLNGLNGQLGGFDRLGRWLGLNGLNGGNGLSPFAPRQARSYGGSTNGFLNGHLNGRLNGRPNGLTGLNGNGLNGHDLQKIELKEKPFVSIHLPFYNEKRVAGRILKACSKFNYPNFEVLVVDDSNDGTTEIVKRWAKKDKRIKLLHRPNREGWKGGALRYALTKIDPKAQFVVVFDADFIPFPDTLDWFLRYFHFLCGGLRNVAKSRIAAVQGYQWHVLNKDENWVTRGIRGEYAGSYIIERSGTELLGSLKQIAGSVYMIRADLLKQFGWGTSITEDFQLTLRLYEKGYKVIYTPYIQAPAECVSTIKRLIRQRMRWAEGHTHNVRKMFSRLWYSPKMNLTEKLEFLYLSPYYLQSLLFLVGTLSWLLADIVFQTGLPFWTATWGWSLVFTNMFSLILMNTVGLFIEESDKRDYQGLLSFLATTYIVVPFQAYAAVKGFFEKEEGHWFRTPKTGLITIELVRGHFARLVGWLLPRRAGQRVRRRLGPKTYLPAVALAKAGRLNPNLNPYLALATANNRFNGFQIIPKRHLRWVSKVVLTILLCASVSLLTLAHNVSVALATNPSGTFNIHTDLSTVLTTTVSHQLKDAAADVACDTGQSAKHAKNIAWRQIKPDVTNNITDPGTPCPASATGTGWIFDTQFGADGYISDGAWNFYLYTEDNAANNVGNIRACVYSVQISGTALGTSTLFFQTTGTTDVWTGGALSSTITTGASPCSGNCTFTSTENYLYVDFYIDSNNGANSATAAIKFGEEQCGTSPYVRIVTPTVQIPEKLIFFLAAAPFIPMMVLWMKKKRGLAAQSNGPAAFDVALMGNADKRGLR